MSDEVTRLKAELNELNMKCQLARDNEVRYPGRPYGRYTPFKAQAADGSRW
jgi:hypothetical protein